MTLAMSDWPSEAALKLQPFYQFPYLGPSLKRTVARTHAGRIPLSTHGKPVILLDCSIELLRFSVVLPLPLLNNVL